ncbi:MAG: rhodanese-related sulfurtransferase [Xanthomonadales bacterium]|nr:rhodanese-related sulfurtransferase [Xanthomonadales bacterium]
MDTRHTAQPADARVRVVSFYAFTDLPGYRALREPLLQRCRDLGLRGTILLAGEGVNGTVAGPVDAVERLLDRLSAELGGARLQVRHAWAADAPFLRMKVRLKKEIVSLGVGGIDPRTDAGSYVAPADWNALIDRAEVRVIDTRNRYEVHLGRFEGAEDPGTEAFRDFPAWADRHLDPERDRHVAMYCTGGIRCEKATAYLKSRGFEHVYHLEGGILNYLEQVPEADSRWRGECFVFDERVTVDHALEAGDHALCPACRMPLEEEDFGHPDYVENLCCPRCAPGQGPERRAALRERARQLDLAAKRGEPHLGPGASVERDDD